MNDRVMFDVKMYLTCRTTRMLKIIKHQGGFVAVYIDETKEDWPRNRSLLMPGLIKTPIEWHDEVNQQGVIVWHRENIYLDKKIHI